MRSILSIFSLQRVVGNTGGSFDDASGPRRFFLPTRVGTGGSHFGACGCLRLSVEGLAVRGCLPYPFDLSSLDCPDLQPHLMELDPILNAIQLVGKGHANLIRTDHC